MTGFYDRRTLELRRAVNPDFKLPGPCLGLEFVHIIPDSTDADLVNGRKVGQLVFLVGCHQLNFEMDLQRNYVVDAWADLSRFGSTKIGPNNFDARTSPSQQFNRVRA